MYMQWTVQGSQNCIIPEVFGGDFGDIPPNKYTETHINLLLSIAI